jgi:hypothetical protein
MRVNEQHNETATACVAEFFTKMTQGQIDARALTTALFNKAIFEMMRMEGADAVHKGLWVYADRFDDRKPNDGTNDNGSRLAESLLTAGYHPELVVQSLIESAAGGWINNIGPEWMARHRQVTWQAGVGSGIRTTRQGIPLRGGSDVANILTETLRAPQ